MRLNLNAIERELEESIADGVSLKGQSSRPETRVRPPYSSRNRSHSTEGRRRGSGLRSKDAQEDSL